MSTVRPGEARRYCELLMISAHTHWAAALPLIPLTRAEQGRLLKQQQLDDERRAMRQLGELVTVSATSSLRLDLTLAVINGAPSKLGLGHREQINLSSILCGARFKCYYRGNLLPTWRPSMFHRQVCGGADAFDHMPQRRNRNRQLLSGPGALEKLSTLDELCTLEESRGAQRNVAQRSRAP